MKKLLIATDCFLPRIDGISVFLSRILPTVCASFEVTVVCPAFGQIPSNLPYKVIQIPLLSLKIGDFTPASFSYKKIKSLVNEHDVVWTHTLSSIGLCATICAKKLQKPRAHYVHSVDWLLVYRSINTYNPFRPVLRFLSEQIVLWTLKNTQRVMIPSKELKELLRIKHIYTKMSIIPLGIDTTQFQPAPDVGVAKEKIGLSKDDVVIGYVGRIAREKDLDTLYASFEMVQKKIPRAKLLIVGSGVAQIEQKLKSNPFVRFVGSQDSVVEYYQAMDVFCHTSLLETTSLVTLEAMACGIIVVVTPAGLIKEYVEDKVNGFIVPYSNTLVTSLKLEYALLHGDQLQELKQKARQTVLDDYSLELSVQKMIRRLRILSGDLEKVNQDV
jgi:1,2-diacylglycerol 3-alpha-glucosyltransferase